MDLGVKSMSFTSSSASWKSTDVVASQFPAGLRVLVVDDDPTCLRILGKMLSNCQYEVTTCNQAVVALDFLRENKNGCDIVISDVHMPDMDGFKLLEHIGLEMDLPVIMMSADDSKDVVMKGVTHGACDYLIKPVRIEALKTIWQHVVRRKKHEWKEKDLEHSGSVGEVERHEKPLEDVDCSSSVNEGSWKNSKKRKDEEDEAEDRDDTSSLKKPRVVWSIELHQQFVTAVNQLGIDKAVPKKILEIMNVPGLTRENVASHLQKYRIYLRRLSGVSHHQNSFMGSSDSPFGPISALNAVDLQALAASGQLPHQSLASIQAASFGRSTLKSAVPSPLVEPRNVFDFKNPKLRFVEGQQQQNGNSKHVSTDSKHLVNMNLHGQSNPLLMQMVQPTTVLVHNGIENICDGPQYTSLSQPSTSASFSSQRSRGFPGNYDVSNDLIQNRTQDWRFGSTYVPPQLPNIRGVDASPSTNKAAFSASDKPSRNKSERLPEMGLNNGLLSGRFGQEDLMSVLLKQQQGMEGDDSDLGFGGFPLDNLPV